MGLPVAALPSPSKPPPDLTRQEAQIAYRMVYGLPRPLSLEEAARAEARLEHLVFAMD